MLCQTARLPTAHVALVEQLTQELGAGRILADLYRRNYFIVKHGHGEAYQLHPLFHEFLLHRAQEIYSLAQLNALGGQAALLLAAAGDIEAAARLWRTASDWVALATHILKHALALVTQARFQLLETWLCALPVITLARTPWLHYWLEVILAKAGSLLSKAFLLRSLPKLFRGFSKPLIPGKPQAVRVF